MSGGILIQNLFVWLLGFFLDFGFVDIAGMYKK